jgi:hypothetical protein
MPSRVAVLTLLFLLVLTASAGAVIVPNKGMAGAKLGQRIDRVVNENGAPDRTFGRHDTFGFVETYTYVQRGLKLEFRQGAEDSLVLTSIRTTKGRERTKEGVGKGTTRKALRARLHGEKCRSFTRPKRMSICWLGSMTPSKPITEFRIDSKQRVDNVRVAYVVD